MITYPLNNILYNAEDAELFHCTRTSGVFSDEDEFAATATGSDNVVTIGPGIAWIRNSRFSGKVAANKANVEINMGIADGAYPRIDAIVVRFDANANQTAIIAKQGLAASNPIAPEVIRTEAIYELHLYHVRRPAGTAVISTDNITDLRSNKLYCGIMMDDVTNVDENKYMSKRSYDPSGTVEAAGGIPRYVAQYAPKTNVVDSVTSTSTTDAASAAAVKKTYDAIPDLSSSVGSTRTDTAATSYAVKQAYDRAADYVSSLRGASNGLVPLGSDGKIPYSYLPASLLVESGNLTITPKFTEYNITSSSGYWHKIGKLIVIRVNFTSNMLNSDVSTNSWEMTLSGLPSGSGEIYGFGIAENDPLKICQILMYNSSLYIGIEEPKHYAQVRATLVGVLS